MYSLAIFSYPVPRSCERFSLLAKLINYAITYFVGLCRYSLRPTKVQLHHNCTQLFRQIKQENEQLLREIINAIWNPNAHSSISSRKYRELGRKCRISVGWWHHKSRTLQHSLTLGSSLLHLASTLLAARTPFSVGENKGLVFGMNLILKCKAVEMRTDRHWEELWNRQRWSDGYCLKQPITHREIILRI